MIGKTLELVRNSHESRFMYQKLMQIFVIILFGILGAQTMILPAKAQSGTDRDGLPTRDQAYLRDLVALSETIGSAHAVRVRCNGVDDQYWRSYMVQILGLEAPFQGNLRRQMVTGFNRGYEQEDAVRRGCDSTSNEREARYATKGQTLAEGLAAYYFPKRQSE